MWLYTCFLTLMPYTFCLMCITTPPLTRCPTTGSRPDSFMSSCRSLQVAPHALTDVCRQHSIRMLCERCLTTLRQHSDGVQTAFRQLSDTTTRIRWLTASKPLRTPTTLIGQAALDKPTNLVPSCPTFQNNSCTSKPVQTDQPASNRVSWL